MGTRSVNRAQWLPPGLTSAQRQAVLADSTVLCVLAGAGTGKTRVLTLRVARRCADGTATPQHTLVCTFSKKAADDLRRRLYRLDVGGVTAGTIHRTALRILHDAHEDGCCPSPNVLGDRRRLLEGLLTTPDAAKTARLLDAEIGWAKAQMILPEEYAQAAQRAERVVRLPLDRIAQLYDRYEGERLRRSLLDLDDLLITSALLIEGSPHLAEVLRWRFRHLYVDEFQDVNAAQFRLLRALAGPDPDLFVVGDPNQAIYGWNGADPDLLGHLGEVFSGARVIRLDDNHRCAPAIVRLATAALGDDGGPQRSTRPEGAVPVLTEHDGDRDEASWVAHQAWLAHRPGRRWSQMAVLARTNAQLGAVATALERQRIPFVYAGGELAPASDLGDLGEDGALENEAETAGTSERTDGVVLSTFHRSKGLQWSCVFVIGLREGLVPIRTARTMRALDEERRLLYVAMTRAEDELFCSWARRTDDAGVARRCRWLAAVENARTAFEIERGPSSDEAVASGFARLRSLVAGPRGG